MAAANKKTWPKKGLDIVKEKLKKRSYEKEARADRENAQLLFNYLTVKLETEWRPQVREIYNGYLHEVDELRKYQDQIKEKWIKRLEFLKSICEPLKKCTSLENIFCFSWLENHRIMTKFVLEKIDSDVKMLEHQNLVTELQFFIMTISKK